MPSTWYDFSADIYYTDANGNWNMVPIDYMEQTDPAPGPPRPSNWAWTSAEEYAFNNFGSVKALSASRWNAFIDRVNDFVVYINAKNSKSISQVPLSDYMGSDKLMYASSFNVVVQTIKNLTGKPMTGITLPRSSGDLIKGSYFPYLSDNLNSL